MSQGQMNEAHAGRVYIISGASEGIGAGMATRLASQGAAIVVASRDADKAAAAIPRIVAAAGGTAAGIKATVIHFLRHCAQVNRFALFAQDIGPGRAGG